MMELFLGAHESVAGGLHLAFERIRSVGGTALQIFTRNQRQWQAPPLSPEEIRLFAQARDKSGRMPVASHASYLINLATGDPALAERSLQALTAEIGRCRQLDIDFLVLHPGSHGGDGTETGLRRIARRLDQCLNSVDDSPLLLLETTAGQGSSLGCRFEELAWIRAHSRLAHRIGFCLDTCHVFCAGYDLRTPAACSAMLTAWDEHVGLEHLRLLHVNDSTRELGSRVDRHAHIGEGHIGLHGLRALLSHAPLLRLPLIIETPKGPDLMEDRKNLTLLRSLILP